MDYRVHYSFNFFAKLPLLAMRNATQQMETFDLTMLSSCSKRCATAVRLSRVPSVEFKILIHMNKIMIQTETKTWTFSSIPQLENRRTSTREPMKELKRFNFKHFPVADDEEGYLETVVHENMDLAFNALISHILFIFPSTTFSKLECIHVPENFHCKVALAGISEVKNLEIYRFGKIEEDVKFILETIQTKRIKDGSRTHASGEWDLKLIYSSQEMFFDDADFLKPFENFENFPNKNTETATFRNVTFDEKDLINFLKWFKDVPADRIGKFKGIKWTSKADGFEIPDLSDFQAKKFNPKERGRYFLASRNVCCAKAETRGGMTPRRQCQHFIDTEDGWDIVRSDGLLGTVLGGDGTIRFLIWHERFPDTGKRLF